MFPSDFAYHRPASLQAAVALYQQLAARGMAPRYYTGGTEIITLARLNLLETHAVIDIKGIGQCCRFQTDPAGGLTIGAAVTLSALSDSNRFPLLGRTAGGVADRTARNKITLGGNLCSEIIYREAVLPLLVADAAVVLAGPAGLRKLSIHQAFDRQLRLQPGEMLVQVEIPPAAAAAPFFHSKRRRSGRVGYPVVTLAALKQAGQLRFAFSGVCAFPFRSRTMEDLLNERALPPEVRAGQALQLLPAPLLDDVEASAGYRAFVLRRSLLDALRTLEGVGG